MNIAGDLVGVIEIVKKRASIMGGKYLHNFCPFFKNRFEVNGSIYYVF